MVVVVAPLYGGGEMVGDAVVCGMVDEGTSVTVGVLMTAVLIG